MKQTRRTRWVAAGLGLSGVVVAACETSIFVTDDGRLGAAPDSGVAADAPADRIPPADRTAPSEDAQAAASDAEAAPAEAGAADGAATDDAEAGASSGGLGSSGGLPTVPATSAAQHVAAQDVTIVYPLPAQANDTTQLISGSFDAAAGLLIPPSALALVGAGLDFRSASVGVPVPPLSSLRLVALRLDPCFDGIAPACIPQLRLVFQGVDAQGGAAFAADGALHVFVPLSSAEFLRAIRQILTLTEQAGGYSAGPLGVHPILAREGPAGPFATGMRSFVYEHAGASRVSRMTFFSRILAPTGTWLFGIIERTPSGFSRQAIATLASQAQNFVTRPAAPNEVSGLYLLPPKVETSLLDLVVTSDARNLPATSRAAAYTSALRIENPRIHSPETVDCASCHIATPLRRSAESVFALSRAGNPNAFQSVLGTAADLPPPSGFENLHALSYLGRELGISQRTANETAAVRAAVDVLLQ